MKIKKIILGVSLLSFGFVEAQNFPWYKTEVFEGWVETTHTDDSHIRVLPKLVAPGNGLLWMTVDNPYDVHDFETFRSTPLGFKITYNNKLKFSFKITSNPKYIPPNFKQDVAQKLNVPFPELSEHQINFVKIDNVKISLYIQNNLIDSKSYDTSLISSDLIDSFYFDLDDREIINGLRSGDFRLEMSYEFPYNTFSSLAFNLNKEIRTDIWIKTFKTISKRIEKTGGKYFFIDWSTTSQKVYAKENITSGANTEIADFTNVVMRNPTIDQLNRFNELLGLVESTKNTIIQNHLNQAKAASDINNLKLANAHELYAQNLESNNNSNFSKELIEALNSLEDTEVLSFLVAGVNLSHSYNHSYYRFDGNINVDMNTEYAQEYTEYIISNSKVEYHSQSSGTSGMEHTYKSAWLQRLKDVFGVDQEWQLNQKIWNSSLRNALEDNRSYDVKYCFQQPINFDPNGNLDNNKNNALYYAIKYGDKDIVEFLLRKGVDPNKKNRFGESAMDIAAQEEKSNIYNLIKSYSGHFGNATIKIKHPTCQPILLTWKHPYTRKLDWISIDENHTKSDIEAFPLLFTSQAFLIFRKWIRSSDLSLFKFQPTIIQHNGNNVLIETKVPLRNDFKIRDGVHVEYEGEIKFKNGGYFLEYL